MERFDILNDDGSVIGSESRENCHNGSFLLHGVVHVLVFRKNGNIILQKRASNKEIQPGKWDSSIGGHISSGETLDSALAREAEEEMGIADADFKQLYSYIMTSEIERELVTTFLCLWDKPVIYQEEEIDEVKEFNNEEIEAELGSGFFTPNFEDEWHYYKEWKKSNA